MKAYFPMSTANPTGQRPWNFVFNGGLSGRRMGFYMPANYPLPQSTLGWAGANRNVPMLATSKYSGKDDYGDPGMPIYSPLSPFFFQQQNLGGLRGRGRGMGAVTFGPFQPTRGGPINVIRPNWPGAPVSVAVPGVAAPVVSAAGTAVTPSASLCSPQNIPAAPYGYQWQPTATDVNGCPTNYQLFQIGSNVPTTLANAQAAQAAAVAAQQAAAAQSIAAQQAAAAGTTTTTVATTTTAPSWFTDPNQELITGLPNWGLLALGGVGMALLMKKK